MSEDHGQGRDSVVRNQDQDQDIASRLTLDCLLRNFTKKNQSPGINIIKLLLHDHHELAQDKV
jgi:hypothetical protein